MQSRDMKLFFAEWGEENRLRIFGFASIDKKMAYLTF